MKVLRFLLSCGLLAVGFASGQTASTAERLAKLEAKVRELQITQKDLIGTIAELLDARVAQGLIQKDVIDSVVDLVDARHTRATLDPTRLKKFRQLDTNLGFVLVSIQQVEPYLDGFKVTLDIGNPLALEYRGFILESEWGERGKSTDGKLKTSFTNTLKPGSWNRIDLILPQTPPDKFGYLSLGLTVNTVHLDRSLE
jgi:Protein of unknown function (DUF3251)